MVWEEPELQPLIKEAKKLIKTIFDSTLNAKVYVCTLEEMIMAVFSELKLRKVSEDEIARVGKRLDYIESKYFKNIHQIWLIKDRGTNLDAIVHEYLHSIQKCQVNREGIVHYLTYKLTGNAGSINSYLLKDWQDIEIQESFSSLKDRFLKEGDCEEFES